MYSRSSWRLFALPGIFWLSLFVVAPAYAVLAMAYMSSNASTTTIPMFLYSNARGGSATPALNALATILVMTTLLGIGVAYLLYTALSGRTSPGEVSALRELSGLEAAA